MAQAKYEIRRRCPICGAIFQIRTIDATYCSKQCSDIAYKRKKDREAKEAKYEHHAVKRGAFKFVLVLGLFCSNDYDSCFQSVAVGCQTER